MSDAISHTDAPEHHPHLPTTTAIVMEGLVGLLEEDFDVVGAVSDGQLLLEAAKRLEA